MLSRVGSLLLVAASLVACDALRKDPAALQFSGPVLQIVDPQLHARALQLLTDKCASCHDTRTGLGGLSYITDLNQLVSHGQVSPGNPAASKLYRRSIDNSMPPGVGLSAADLQLLSDWISKAMRYSPGSSGPAPTPLSLSFPPSASERTKKALTLLNERCVSCHSSTSGESAGGGVVEILNPPSLLVSGLVVPGDAQRSPLFDSVARNRMPKGASLSASDRGVLEEWINLDIGNNPEGIAGVSVPTLTPTYTSIRNNILSTRCLVCHGGVEDTKGGYSYATYTETKRSVVVGNPNQSKLYRSVQDGSMPERFHALTALEIDVIGQWISSGAPNN